MIARYRASGLGLKAFALEEGLPPGRLHYWVYQKAAGLRGRGAAGPRHLAVLGRLPSMTANQVRDLLPANWKPRLA
jgi:hypothetical protein